MTAQMAHRYKAIYSNPADGPWRPGQFKFIAGEHYGATRPAIKPNECVKVAGNFTETKTGQPAYKTLLLWKEVCKKNLIHEPLKS